MLILLANPFDMEQFLFYIYALYIYIYIFVETYFPDGNERVTKRGGGECSEGSRYIKIRHIDFLL